MFDIAHRTASAFRSWVRDLRYRAGYRLAQCRRAWHVAIDGLSPDDAQRMLDCRGPAGWHRQDSLEQAREELADHPELPRLLADGCARVADKRESYNDELWEARRWAINLAREYAVDEGITLTALDDEREPAS